MVEGRRTLGPDGAQSPRAGRFNFNAPPLRIDTEIFRVEPGELPIESQEPDDDLLGPNILEDFRSMPVPVRNRPKVRSRAEVIAKNPISPEERAALKKDLARQRKQQAHLSEVRALVQAELDKQTSVRMLREGQDVANVSGELSLQRQGARSGDPELVQRAQAHREALLQEEAREARVQNLRDQLADGQLHLRELQRLAREQSRSLLAFLPGRQREIRNLQREIGAAQTLRDVLLIQLHDAGASAGERFAGPEARLKRDPDAKRHALATEKSRRDTAAFFDDIQAVRTLNASDLEPVGSGDPIEISPEDISFADADRRTAEFRKLTAQKAKLQAERDGLLMFFRPFRLAEINREMVKLDARLTDLRAEQTRELRAQRERAGGLET